MDEFINRLRASTASLHKSLEASGLTQRLMAEDVTTGDYYQYLQASLRMQQEVEQSVFPELTGLITDMDRRKKSGAIAQDIEQLRAQPGVQAAATSPFINEQFRGGKSFSLGMLYVTEGSTLGGLYILKHLKGKLGEHIPSSFLGIYGEKTGPLWREFLKELADYVNASDEQAKDEIISGAIYAFERAHAVFNSRAGNYAI